MLTSRYVLRQETQIQDTTGIISCKYHYYGITIMELKDSTLTTSYCSIIVPKGFNE